MDSQAIVNTMEVLETKPVSELVTEAVIKVCYVSDDPNRNDTVIDRETGKQIAATLPGAPVVGFFNEETGDFEEHSRQIVIKDGTIKVKDLTKAYGFVSFEDPYYQDFSENGQIRTYLMCKAYLWTRQYEEASLALNKGQSMELDEETMSGYYQGDVFVFTDVTLDKLCILGDAFSPCFEGAKIMTTYCKQYESLAEQVEKTIGRRYYVVADKLVVKPNTNYALKVGWDLSDAVYNQLNARGMNDYYVNGIFIEGTKIFTVLQNMINLEYVMVDVTITENDTVELGTELTVVTMKWVPKPAEPAPPAEPITGEGAIDPNQEVPLNVSATFTANEGEGEGETPPTTEFSEGEGGEQNPAPVAEGEGEENPPAGEFSENTPTATNPAPEGEPAAGTEPPPAAAFSAEAQAHINTLTAQIADLTTKFGAATEQVNTLTASLEQFKADAAKAADKAKEDMLASYSESLTEEEIQPVKDKISEYTLEQVEEKLAVLFTRKQKTAPPADPRSEFQVAVNNGDEDAGLPDFMKRALEFDTNRQFDLVLKA